MDTPNLESPPDAPPVKIDPILLGTCCGIVSAICYTLANICLRHLVAADPTWVSCVKSIPTILLIGPWVLVRQRRGQQILPGAKVLVILILAGIFGQVAGNVPFQWSLGVIGMALSVPLLFGMMIISGAIMGRILLHEPLLPRTLVSIVLLVSAGFTLSLGAAAANRAVKQETAASQASSAEVLPTEIAEPMPLIVLGGVFAACLAGLAYSTLGVAIRYGVTNHAPISSTLLIVGVLGLIVLGAMSLARIGVAGMLETTWRDLGLMLLAGVANAVAFAALTKGLQLISVVYVNALNATQIVMAVLAGVVFFEEARSITLILGVLLTIAGLFFMKGREKHIAAQKAARTAAAKLVSEQSPL